MCLAKHGVTKEKEMSMKHIKLSAAVVLTAAIITGCSTAPVCITSSVTPMNGKIITENLGKCEGKDSAYSFLGLFMIGRPDLDLAIKDALSRKGGDTLVNVRCYESLNYYLLFSINTVTVEGEAVKFTADEVSGRGKGK